MKILYEEAEDVRKIAENIVKKLNLSYIDLSRVHFIRSKNSRSKYTIARCYGLSKIWQYVLNKKSMYIIEVISEKFDYLSEKRKKEIILHELLHIPKTFSGGLRNHKIVYKELRRLYKKL